jgi:hypothetical protein
VVEQVVKQREHPVRQIDCCDDDSFFEQGCTDGQNTRCCADFVREFLKGLRTFRLATVFEFVNRSSDGAW